MSKVSPITLAESAGELLWYDGGLITFKATGAQTAGDLLLFEAWMPRGKATPLHAHPDSHESFYVMHGDLLMQIGDADGKIAAGAVVMVPRGVPHAFAVTSESARLLVVHTPASETTEAFFRAAGEPASSPTLPPAGEHDRARMVAAAKASGLQVLGPPPFPGPGHAAGS